MSEDVFKLIFSKNLRYYMSQEGKTQIDIVNDLGINKSSISSWVNGTRLPRMDKIEMLAQYLGISRTDLIEERAARKEPAPAADLTLTPTERSLIIGYRAADPGTQASVRKLLDVGEEMKESEAG